MFVNGNMFMITSARKLKFETVEHIPIETSDHLQKSLNIVIKLNGIGGLIIRTILMNMYFEKMLELLVNGK